MASDDYPSTAEEFFDLWKHQPRDQQQTDLYQRDHERVFGYRDFAFETTNSLKKDSPLTEDDFFNSWLTQPFTNRQKRTYQTQHEQVFGTQDKNVNIVDTESETDTEGYVDTTDSDVGIEEVSDDDVWSSEHKDWYEDGVRTADSDEEDDFDRTYQAQPADEVEEMVYQRRYQPILRTQHKRDWLEDNEATLRNLNQREREAAWTRYLQRWKKGELVSSSIENRRTIFNRAVQRNDHVTVTALASHV